MKTNQPKRAYLANLGDATPLDYGGAFVMEDETGVYCPELWTYDADSRERSTILLEPVTPCPDLPGQFGDNRFHPNHPAWWSDKLQSVADCHGMDVEELHAMLCSGGAIERAMGYQCLVGYFGTYEFDQYPCKLTRKEAETWMESIDDSLV